MSVPRVKTLAVLGVSVLALAGCGSARPGVAVEVDGKTVSLSEVDATAQALCDGLAPLNEQAGGNQPRHDAGSTAAAVALQGLLADLLDEEYDISPSAAFTAQVEAMRADAVAQGVAEEHVDEIVDALANQYRLADAQAQVGAAAMAAQGTTDIDQQQAQELGGTLLAGWFAERDIEIDPRFGLSFEGGTPVLADTRTSTAVSDLAVLAADGERAAELPRNLLCTSD
ncbi:MAG: hypothetical protein ACI379_05330 [Nocardioides sp.]|uniref:hypothetical protein n=1 Tax=Nocardioides sp. TaxID=35761 RepID=UPI003F0664B1